MKHNQNRNMQWERERERRCCCAVWELWFALVLWRHTHTIKWGIAQVCMFCNIWYFSYFLTALWLLNLMKDVESCISMKTLDCLFCSAWMHLVRWGMMLWTIIFIWLAQMKRASMSRPVWSSLQMSCSLWLLLLSSSIRFNPAVSELGE